jgi:hypothetical protein
LPQPFPCEEQGMKRVSDIVRTSLKIEEQGNPASLTVYAGVGYLTGFYRKLEIGVSW